MNAFQYRIEKMNHSKIIIWDIIEDYNHNNKRPGFLLRESKGYNFLLIDLNIYNNYPVINIIFKPKNLRIGSDNNLCFRFLDSKIIEIQSDGNHIYNQNKNILRFPLSKEALNSLTNNGLSSIYIESSDKTNKTTFKSCTLKKTKRFESFTMYATIYDYILKKLGLYDSIPNMLDNVRIGQEITNCKEINDNMNQNISEIEENVQLCKNNEECYVYLMHDTLNNFYKIGISKTPQYRERTLQSEKPSIEILYAKKYPNRRLAYAIEQALHKVFSEKKIRGEWFNLSEADIAMLKDTLK